MIKVLWVITALALTACPGRTPADVVSGNDREGEGEGQGEVLGDARAAALIKAQPVGTCIDGSLLSGAFVGEPFIRAYSSCPHRDTDRPCGGLALACRPLVRRRDDHVDRRCGETQHTWPSTRSSSSVAASRV